jgi:hypothetical protein
MLEELSPPDADCLGEPQQPAFLADESTIEPVEVPSAQVAGATIGEALIAGSSRRSRGCVVMCWMIRELCVGMSRSMSTAGRSAIGCD